MATLLIPTMRIDNDSPLPSYATAGAAGIDLVCNLEDGVILKPGARAAVPTGIAMAIPRGYEATIRGRSGLAFKHGIGLVNGVGTIDSDYRGEILVLLINHGDETISLRHGERIAQLVFTAVATANLQEVDTLSETARGAGGLGHTGRS